MPILRSNKARVIITMGDPAGIGPEVSLKALASSRVRGLADFLLIGDRFVIDAACKKTGIKLKVPFCDLSNVERTHFSYGSQSPSCGKASMDYIDRALEILRKDGAGSLVTAPINKSSIRLAGFKGFQGHTEYLAEHTSASDYAMMFVGEKLLITLVTRHIAVARIPEAITTDTVYKTIAITHKALKDYFGMNNPRIGVAALNPHAGEGGVFGREEIDAITPAVKKADMVFGNVTGPISADTLFYHAMNNKFDACVAMYHDQALSVFKLLYFKTGVNLTIGLPFVRTSPDHGTGFDIAGKGIADPMSMIGAITLACRLSGR